VAREGIEILLVEDNPAKVLLTLRAQRQEKLANRVERARCGLGRLVTPPPRGRGQQECGNEVR
jgi:hypothetical protein